MYLIIQVYHGKLSKMQLTQRAPNHLSITRIGKVEFIFFFELQHKNSSVGTESQHIIKAHNNQHKIDDGSIAQIQKSLNNSLIWLNLYNMLWIVAMFHFQ